jgi:N-acetylglucosamine kinase-like BadF-type ATPase
MLLIVDSGSTKADWRLVFSNGEQRHYVGEGINPYHILPENLAAAVDERVPEIVPSEVLQLFFYGAGCANEHRNGLLAEVFSRKFFNAKVQVASDALGAARALFGKSSGVVAILGTGSACCLYNGEQVVASTSSLGYMLGDEGSATDLGKRLLRAFFYKQLPEHLSAQLLDRGVSRENMLHEVYHSAKPAAYLSGFVGFLLDNKDEEAVKSIVQSSFSDFFSCHVKQLYQQHMPLGVAGSVASLFSDIFLTVAQKYGVQEVDFLQYPIDKLVAYHNSLR